MTVSPIPAPLPAAPSKPKKVLRSIAAAFTSPTAIKEEKILGVLVATRLLLSAGASAALIDAVVRVVQAL